jgi:hypothetical protein
MEIIQQQKGKKVLVNAIKLMKFENIILSKEVRTRRHTLFHLYETSRIRMTVHTENRHGFFHM